MTAPSPAELLHGTPSPTRQRWEPLRAGIIGLFRYDEQVFAFHRGRLLLRGNNGSGKSMALEVLLPYVLDADLSPERLSTFGGRDRGMYLWLLGHDSNTDRQRTRGYVWVEFGRVTPRGDEFCTVGAGLSATRTSTKVTSWYFTTAARVGVDLTLGAAGSEPLSQAQLTVTLADLAESGKLGAVHPGPEEHRREVNRVLYGLDDKQFDALRKTMLHLRKPKLSDKLDENKLDEVLRDALPPVSQTVTNELAEGFERLDRHRAEIEKLTNAHGALNELYEDYARYVRVVTEQRAHDVAQTGSDLDAAQAAAVDARAAHADTQEAITIALQRKKQLNEEVDNLAADIAAIKDDDIYREGANIEPLREKAVALASAASEARKQADKLQAAASLAAEKTSAADADAHDAVEARDRHATRSIKISAHLRNDALLHLVTDLSTKVDEPAVDQLRRAVQDERERLVNLRHLVQRARKATKDLSEAGDRAATAKANVAEADKAVTTALDTEASALAEYMDAVTTWTSQSTQLMLGLAPPERWPAEDPERTVTEWLDAAARHRRQQLQDARDAVKQVVPRAERLVSEATALAGGCADLAAKIASVQEHAERTRSTRIEFTKKVRLWVSGLEELTREASLPDAIAAPSARSLTREQVTEWATAAARARSRAIGSEESKTRTELDRFESELKAKVTEHQNLARGGLPATPVPPTRLANRSELAGAPFYQLVDFTDGAGDEETRAMLEASLVGSGLADAWVSPDGSVITGPDGAPLLDVQLLRSSRPATSPLSTALRPEPAVDNPVVEVEVVETLLGQIELAGTAPSDGSATFAVAWDGTWAAGNLRGAFRKTTVELIGAAGRETRRRRRMEELAEQMGVLNERVDKLERHLGDLADAHSRVEDEQNSVPGDVEVRNADSEHTKIVDRVSEDVRDLVSRAVESSEDDQRTVLRAAEVLVQHRVTSLDVMPEHVELRSRFEELREIVLSQVADSADSVWGTEAPLVGAEVINAASVRVARAAKQRALLNIRLDDAVSLVAHMQKDLDAQVTAKPSSAGLAAAAVEVTSAQRVADRELTRLTAAREAEVEARILSEEAETAAATALDLAGLAESGDELGSLLDAVDRFRTAAEDWLNAAGLTARLTAVLSAAKEAEVDASAVAEESATHADAARRDAELAHRKYTDLNDQMGTPHRELVARLAALETRLIETRKSLEKTSEKHVELERKIGELTSDVSRTAADVVFTTERLATSAEKLADLHRLGLLEPDDVGSEFSAGVGSLTPEQLGQVRDRAARIAARTRQTHTTEQRDKAQSSVITRRQAVEYRLSDQVLLREQIRREVLTITAMRNGAVRPLEQTLAALTKEVHETEELLRKEEAELFERFLSDEVRLEVGDRIHAAVVLVQRMNKLMENHPTSSEIRFKLAWIPNPESEVPTKLREFMLKPEGTLLASERTQLAGFYRHQITRARMHAAQLSWRQQLTTLLDYRLWHTFKLQAKRAHGPWLPLTKRVHGQMSGGEKAVALHMPLFAAAATHCDASRFVVDGEDGPTPGCPRLILLDEVFAGVDAENRGALFDLVRRLDLDLVATSESEQGLYPELNGLSIYQLIVDDALPGVLAVRSVWDGQAVHRMLDHDMGANT
jgi:hypothetical protein